MLLLRGHTANVPILLFSPDGSLLASVGENDVGAGEGDAGDHRGFQGQGAEVFRLEVVDVALAAGAGQDLNLG